MRVSTFVCLLLVKGCCAFSPTPLRGHERRPTFNPPPVSQQGMVASRAPTALAMGVFDLISNFLDNREGDFIKLEDSGKSFGPGPLLLLYNVPAGIEDEEVHDILEDGAPAACRKGCGVYRFNGDGNSLLDLPLQDSLEKIARREQPPIQIETTAASVTSGIPVIFFSGFENKEMLATYNILSQQINAESGGKFTPACAKAVPNAMDKPLRQVLEEISGDHSDATGDN